MKNPKLERCGHCAEDIGDSILILGGYREQTDLEQDSLTEHSVNSSRLASSSTFGKPFYYKMEDLVILEIGHEVA
jgi:hypothetical protein